jgi:DNA (cytosine-5)-methyltransferase 1
MTNPLRFISLFAGIGGFDLALERAGMVCVGQVEKDRHCQGVLAHHFPNVKRMGDIRNVGYEDFEGCDVLVGGSPCQDVSVAGRRKGLAGERSGLWFEFHRLIREIRPKYVIFENVPGLLSSRQGRDFAVILGGFTGWIPDVPDAGWKSGGVIRGYRGCYHAAWRVLDAQYFGVPQRRRRVFIVASLGDGSCAEILFESESRTWNPQTRRKARQGAARHASGHTGTDGEEEAQVVGTLAASGAGSSRPAGQANETDMLIYGMQRSDEYDETDVASTQSHRQGKSATDLVVEALDVRNSRSNGDIGGRARRREASSPVKHSPPPLKSADSGTNQVPSVFTRQAIAFDANGGDDSKWADRKGGGRKEIVRSGDYSGTLGADGNPDAIAYASGVRRLTPVECERLQGFPDGWTEGQSDSMRYRQLGNAIAVPVVEWIGRRMVEVHAKDNP